MTLEEAKKILEKEGFKLGGPGKPGKPGVVSEAFAEYESPEICEAMQIVCSAGFQLAMLAGVFDERKERLKKEYEKNTKAPVSGKEQPKEKKGIIYPTTFPKADFYYKHVLNEGNPALAESASQFNDALLDEQAKKIAELTKEKSNLEDQITVLNACKKHNDKINRKQIKCLGKEIARLNGIIHKKNLKIDELKKESSEHLAGKVKLYGETVDLSQELCDKNEDIRLSKIREKNLVEVCQKYVKENEELKKKLADKVVDKINANALKSAESALACKEQLIYYKDKIIANNKKKIADLGKELKAQKDLVDDISLKYDGAKHNLKLRMDECEKLKKELEKMTKLVETVRKGSKEYCDYGIAAEKMIQKMAKEIVNDSPVPSKDYEQYRLWANGCRFNPHLPDFSEEELMKLQEKACVDIAEKDEVIADLGNELEATKKELEAFKESYKRRIKEDSEHFEHIQKICNAGLQKWLIESEYLEKDKPFRFPQQPELSEEEEMYDSIIERCKRLGIELHYHDGKVPTYTNVLGDEVPVYGLRGIFATCTDEEYKSLFKK